MPAGHRVRLVVFASVVEPVAQPGLLVVPLGHVVAFLQRTVSDYWSGSTDGWRASRRTAFWRRTDPASAPAGAPLAEP